MRKRTNEMLPHVFGVSLQELTLDFSFRFSLFLFERKVISPLGLAGDQKNLRVGS